MRRLLGVLREDGGDAALAPQPGIAQLDALVAGVRTHGLAVELAVEGHCRGLPPALDLSAYRIVQEALTNALKHAAGASAQVRVRRLADAITIDVLDDGAGAANGEPASGGHGLVGMRERVALFGGELRAHPRPEGGFAVHARLPLTERRA
jgi:signal transduction histidine kinase